MKGLRFHFLMYIKGLGNVLYRSVKRPKRAKKAFYGSEKVGKMFWFM